MPPKKANEAYFGDVFNRPSSLACYYVDDSERELGYIQGYDIAPNCDYTAVMEKGTNGAISCVTEDIESDISAILARLGALESQLKKENARDDLRSALKTLNYTREL